ncbi:F5/8 type C domain-containing protein [Marinilabilia salmonicolor]|uniref:F5/8 type C domain-containing protein n=1 Tax=Marinilabilia salmonicolor TaxID=989 RepID=A0A368UUS6_9BACT|nr:F5/8 type C domain-containing protein [Marinilabilia salmonicolor]
MSRSMVFLSACFSVFNKIFKVKHMRLPGYFSLLILAAFYFCSSAPSDKGTANSKKQNLNPIVPDNLADPSVVMFDDTFYMYATIDIDHDLKEMGPPVVWKSTDFVNWNFEGTIIPQINWNEPHTYTDKEGKERTGYFRYWAPGKPLKKDGKYYIFPTIVKPDDSMGTYVMVSDEPGGPFDFATGSGLYFNEDPEDETQPLIPDIDGEPFVDDNGEVYIFWRRRKAAKLSHDLLSLDGEIINIPTEYGGYSEGPVMFKRDSLYYYIYTLSGHANYCNGYMISREGPLGPFETPKGESVFIYSNSESGVWGPGHGNVFRMPGTEDYYFLYLEYGEGGTTRQIFANKLNFNEDGTIKPVMPDFKGVGYLGEKDIEGTLISDLNVSASSYRSSKIVEASVVENPNNHDNIKAAREQAEKRARTFSYQPELVLDNSNYTRWYAREDGQNPMVTFDLKEAKMIDRCEMFFVLPAFGHSWILEKSMNGTDWVKCDRQENITVKSPHIGGDIGEARFLRLKITDGEPGLWEFKIYGK